MEKPNRNKLIQLMTDYRVSIKDVALLINKAEITIRIFRSVSGVDITGNDLELLELKLAAKYDR